MTNHKEVSKNESESLVTWEVDYFECPFIFKGDGGVDIKSATLVFADEASHFLMGTKVILMDEHYLDRILVNFLETVENSDFHPGKILVKKKDLFELLEEIVGDFDLELELVKKLPAIESAKRGFRQLLGQ